MANMVPPGFKKELLSFINRKIHELILDPQFKFKVSNIKILRLTNFRTSDSYQLIYLNIKTNNRPLLLGQFVYFTKNDFRGFHLNYLYGLMEGWAEANYKKFAINIDFFINVEDSKGTYSDIYKYIPSSEALNNKIITLNSPIGRIVKKYNISHILIAGNEISSPTIGMTRVIERICRKYKPKRVLDMFAGVGSLSKICLTFGADHVDCVESNGKVINANLVQFKGKYNLIERDAFSFSITENYDLIILDPFFDQSYRVADLILSNINNYGSLIVMDIGPKFDTFWSRRVLSRINNIRFRKFSIADQVICVFKKEAF